MNNLNSNFLQTKKSFVFIISLLIVSILTLFVGTLGLIENKSPQDLESLTTLSISFITYIEYHAMIFIGTMGIIFTAWFSQHN